MNYPEQKVPMFPKYRGKQVLMRDENGLEKCVACGLCAVACPADAIYLEAAENDGTVQAGPRYAKVYQIHKTRCIFCGYCEEACPVSAIFMGKDYELAVYSKDDFIWDKTDLLGRQLTTCRLPGRDAAAATPAPANSTVANCHRHLYILLTSTILDEIARRVLVCDGAMGTMLYSKGVFVNRCFESLNLTQPDLVAEVHLDYVRAGRRRDRDQHLRREPRQAGVLRARRQGAGHQRRRARAWPGTRRASRCYVAGAIGPLGIRIEPWGKTGVDEARGVLPRAGARRCSTGGVDLFILETFRDLQRDRRRDRRRPQRCATCRSSRR